MAAKRIGTALPWSHSHLNAYETCPKRFYLTRITKEVTEAQTPQMAEGNKVHKALELYVKGDVALPENYSLYQPMADKLMRAPGEKKTEMRFGITERMTPTTFFGDDVWLRGVLDLSIVRPKTAIILDYKTGKRKPEADQLKLFAMATFALYPHVEKVKTGYVWLAEDKMDTEDFVRTDAVRIHQEFSARVHVMKMSEKNNDWPAIQSGLCRNYCPVGKARCSHCGKN